MKYCKNLLLTFFMGYSIIPTYLNRSLKIKAKALCLYHRRQGAFLFTKTGRGEPDGRHGESRTSEKEFR